MIKVKIKSTWKIVSIICGHNHNFETFYSNCGLPFSKVREKRAHMKCREIRIIKVSMWNISIISWKMTNINREFKQIMWKISPNVISRNLTKRESYDRK